MSFDIARTPTLEAVATQDEQALAQDLQKRVDEAIQAAESAEQVVGAVSGSNKASERLAKMRSAERALSVFAKDSREQAAAAAESVMSAAIESAIAGDK